MMTNKFTALAVAVALSFGVASAQAATPSGAQVVVVPAAKMAVARRNVEVATAANQRATELGQALNDPRFRSASTPDEYIAAIEAMMPQIEASRAELGRLRAQLEALPTVAEAGDAQQLKMIDVMVDDFAASVGRTDTMLETVVALGVAMRTRDADAVDRALAALSGSLMVAMDSQALMLRSRVILTDPDSTVYAQTMTLACFYESLAAVTRGQLEFVARTDAVARSETSLECVREQMTTGRQALARDGEQLSSNVRIRAMQTRLAEINGRMFDEMGRAEAGLASATAVLKAGGDYDAIEIELDKFQAAELALSQLANEQMLAATAGGR